jgi:hypothetical protein
VTVVELAIELKSGRRFALHYADREAADVALMQLALTDNAGTCDLTDSFDRREAFAKADFANVEVRDATR